MPVLGLVSITDRRWFDYLAGKAAATGGRLDEVNFWRPRNQNAVRAIGPGAPFFLRLAAPVNAVAGFGFFAHWKLVPFGLAWELFGDKNGVASFDELRTRIAAFRRGDDPAAPRAAPLGCVVLRDVTFLPEREWLPWGAAEGWSRQIVNDKSYELGAPPGAHLLQLVTQRARTPADLDGTDFRPLETDERAWRERRGVVREGQGTFRLRLIDAYGGRCAITGEKVLPVLEAAHIQPYLGPASNHIQNGLLLKSDLHHLYDDGYLTVTPDYSLRVSERIFSEYGNGREYLALNGRKVILPRGEALRPSREALAWHVENRYR